MYFFRANGTVAETVDVSLASGQERTGVDSTCVVPPTTTTSSTRPKPLGLSSR